MAWLTREELEALGLKHLGKDVKVSDKASLLNPEQLSICLLYTSPSPRDRG